MLKKNLASITLIFTIIFISDAQIVNVESLRMKTNDQLFLMNGSTSFSYSNNDGNYNFKISINAGATLKSENKKNTYFLIGDYTLNRSKLQDFQNDWFAHLRYNYEHTDLFRWEVFTQGQGNQILDIELRYLIGTGPRLKFVLKKAVDKNNDTGIRCYLGNAYMYEIERSSINDQHLYQHRHSSYLSFSVDIPKTNLSITNTMYYQPLYKDFSDYRLNNQFQLGIPITKESLSFNTAFSYSYDSLTPANKSQYTSYISLGLQFTLSSKNEE